MTYIKKSKINFAYSIIVFIFGVTKQENIMKKTVLYNNEKIKVDFIKENFTRNIIKTEGIRIIEANGTEDFIINGVRYTINWSMRNKEKSSVTLSYGDFTCGDSEKKMIEHLISIKKHY